MSGPLFVGHMMGPWPMKRIKNLHQIIILIVLQFFCHVIATVLSVVLGNETDVSNHFFTCVCVFCQLIWYRLQAVDILSSEPCLKRKIRDCLLSRFGTVLRFKSI